MKPVLRSRAIQLELTVPCDERFRSVLSAMCERMAQYVGFPPSEAGEVSKAVGRAVEGVLAHGDAPEYRGLTLTIATTNGEIEFQIRYLCGAAIRTAPPAPPRIEQFLRRTACGEAPLDAMQRVMHRVAFDREDDAELCTLIRALPPD